MRRNTTFETTILLVSATLALGCDPTLTIIRHDGGVDASESPAQGQLDGGAPGNAPTDPGDAAVGDAGDAAAPDAGDAAAVPDGGDTTPKGGHVIDGVNDFASGEKLATSSAAPNRFDGYLSWDAERIYVGMSGPDIATANGKYWVLVYIGGDGGTTSGLAYGPQKPTLAFPARYHVRWKGDRSYTNTQEWSGTAWVDAAATIPVAAAATGSFVEMSLQRSALGDPAKLRIHVNMIVEAEGEHWTYAAVPSASLVDGLDRDYTKYLEIDLGASKKPAEYVPLP